MESDFIVSAIAGSSLSTEEKTRVLLVGATHKDGNHRTTALSKLKDFDRAQFNDLLVKHIDGISPNITNSLGTCTAGVPVRLAIEAGDEGVWHALLRLARRVDARTRLEMVELYDIRNIKSQQVLPEFLAVFLNDAAVRELKLERKFGEPYVAFSSFTNLEVRNGAAMMLGLILNLETEPAENWQPAQWAAYRKEVRASLRLKGIEPMTEK